MGSWPGSAPHPALSQHLQRVASELWECGVTWQAMGTEGRGKNGSVSLDIRPSWARTCCPAEQGRRRRAVSLPGAPATPRPPSARPASDSLVGTQPNLLVKTSCHTGVGVRRGQDRERGSLDSPEQGTEQGGTQPEGLRKGSGQMQKGGEAGGEDAPSAGHLPGVRSRGAPQRRTAPAGASGA